MVKQRSIEAEKWRSGGAEKRRSGEGEKRRSRETENREAKRGDVHCVVVTTSKMRIMVIFFRIYYLYCERVYPFLYPARVVWAMDDGCKPAWDCRWASLPSHPLHQLHYIQMRFSKKKAYPSLAAAARRDIEGGEEKDGEWWRGGGEGCGERWRKENRGEAKTY